MDLPARDHPFEQIHGILWDKIRGGKIIPGQRLMDIEWARKLNVSRTPVREAMRKKDGARAAMLMQSHVRETAEDLMPVLPETLKGGDQRSAA
jgi:DNA-binding GntR family transcriptional regulator